MRPLRKKSRPYVPKRELGITVSCIDCGERFKFLVAARDYAAWHDQHKPLRKAMPYLSSIEEYALIHHVCGICLPKWFPEME